MSPRECEQKSNTKMSENTTEATSCPTAVLIEIEEENDENNPLFATPLKLLEISPMKINASLRKATRIIAESKQLLESGLIEDEKFDFPFGSCSDKEVNRYEIDEEEDEVFMGPITYKEERLLIQRKLGELDNTLPLSTEEMDEVWQEATKLANEFEMLQNSSEHSTSEETINSSNSHETVHMKDDCVLLEEPTEESNSSYGLLKINVAKEEFLVPALNGDVTHSANDISLGYLNEFEIKNIAAISTLEGVNEIENRKRIVEDLLQSLSTPILVNSLFDENNACLVDSPIAGESSPVASYSVVKDFLEQNADVNGDCEQHEPETDAMQSTLTMKTEIKSYDNNENSEDDSEPEESNAVSMIKDNDYFVTNDCKEEMKHAVDVSTISIDTEPNICALNSEVTQNITRNGELEDDGEIDRVVSPVEEIECKASPERKILPVVLESAKGVDSREREQRQKPGTKTNVKSVDLSSNIVETAEVDEHYKTKMLEKPKKLQKEIPRMKKSGLKLPGFGVQEKLSESSSSVSSLSSTSSNNEAVFKNPVKTFAGGSEIKSNSLPRGMKPGFGPSSRTTTPQPQSSSVKKDTKLFLPSTSKKQIQRCGGQTTPKPNQLEESSSVKLSLQSRATQRTIKPSLLNGSNTSKVRQTHGTSLLNKEKEPAIENCPTPSKKFNQVPKSETQAPLAEKTNRRVPVYGTPARQLDTTCSRFPKTSIPTRVQQGSFKGSGTQSKIPSLTSWKDKKTTSNNQENKLL